MGLAEWPPCQLHQMVTPCLEWDFIKDANFLKNFFYFIFYMLLYKLKLNLDSLFLSPEKNPGLKAKPKNWFKSFAP